MKRALLSLLSVLLVTGCGGMQRNESTATITPRGPQQIANDAAISRELRKNLINSDLSPTAQNLFIGTIDGIVTIRGAVESDAEKARVEQAARNIPNVRGVKAELTPIQRPEVH